jgi:hypothetical protein
MGELAAFLGTLADGGSRLHPMCPLLTEPGCTRHRAFAK